MKKILLFAAAALTMSVGCSKIQELINPDKGQEQVDDTTPVEIKFTTNVANVETKGVGALTGLTESNTLYIYGLNRSVPGALEIVNAPAHTTVNEDKEGNTNTLGTLEFNPVDHDDNTETPDAKPTYFYSGTTHTYDFYGYYVDDACGKTDGVVNVPSPDSDYKLNITINGTQDILLGKADQAADVAGNAEGVTEDQAYSAFSARRGVTPNIVFDHALTRYTFTLLNKGTKAIEVEKIEVMSKTKGVLTVAGTQDLAMDATETTESPLSLDSKDLPKELGTYDKNTSEPVELAGSIMTFAGQSNTLVLTLSQTGMLDSEKRVVKMPIKVTGGTKPATSYELAVVVYSLESIDLNVTLKPWGEGGSIELDPEDDDMFDEGEVKDNIVNRQ